MTPALFLLRGGRNALEGAGWPGAVAVIAIVVILVVWPRIMNR
jgi:hypothetical protein